MTRPLPSSTHFPYTTLFRSQLRPNLYGLLITGYASLASDDADLPRLSKPFRAADLAREIEKLLSDGTVVDFSSHRRRDRKSTRLNSSHLVISYAVFCFNKQN